MGIFERISGGQSSGQRQISPQDMRAEMRRIQADPGDYLKQRGFSIPGGMNDPKQITQYLLQSGQVGVGRLQQVMRMLGR